MNDVQVSIIILTMVGRKVLCSLETGENDFCQSFPSLHDKESQEKIDRWNLHIMSIGPKNIVNI